MLINKLLSLDKVQQQFNSLFGHFRDRLANSGKGWGQESSQVNIINADQGHIIWDLFTILKTIDGVLHIEFKEHSDYNRAETFSTDIL